MIDQSWVLTGVDAQSRQRALAEAERRGVSLADYLTELVLQTAGLSITPEPAPLPPPSPTRAEGLELRHRLEALDRRLSVGLGGFDASLQAVDASVDELGERVLGAEKSIAETAEQGARALEQLNSVRQRIDRAEAALGALGDAHDGLRTSGDRNTESLAKKLDVVAATANATAGAVTVLEEAHDRLKRVLVEELSDLARETAERVDGGLDEARAMADAAAERADLAVARLAHDLANVRRALELGLEEGAANARALVQAAFEDAADRILAIAQGLSDVDRRQARRADQLQASIADAQAANKAAIQQTAAGLRQADAELAAQLARNAKDGQAALGVVHETLSAELAEVRQQQTGAEARLDRLDAASSANASSLATIGELIEGQVSDIEQRLDAALKQMDRGWGARFEALASQAAARQHAQSADLERVELSTIAALETLSDTMRARDVELDARLTAAAAETNGLITTIEARLETEGQKSAGQYNSLLTRVAEVAAAGHGLTPRVAALEANTSKQANDSDRYERLLDDRLAPLARTNDVARIDARLGAVEAIVQDTTSGEILRQRLEALSAQVAALGDHQGLAQRLEDLRARLTPIEAQASEAASGMQGVARMLGRLTAQNADASAQSEKRMHKLEAALADLHLERLRERDNDPATGIEARVKAFEERHETALDALRAEIAQFVSGNDRRLAALERGELPGGEDLAAAFDLLRRRMDERVADVEQRSARALEQVADTVSLIERRLLAAGPAR